MSSNVPPPPYTDDQTAQRAVYPPLPQAPPSGYYPPPAQAPSSGYYVPVAQAPEPRTIVTLQPAPVQQQVIVIGTSCPVCRCGVLVDDFTCMGIFLCIVFFPFGIICCMLMKRKVCSHCHATF